MRNLLREKLLRGEHALGTFYELGGMKLYVSQGAGFWAGFPVRSGTFNEIPLITFTRAN